MVRGERAESGGRVVVDAEGALVVALGLAGSVGGRRYVSPIVGELIGSYD